MSLFRFILVVVKGVFRSSSVRVIYVSLLIKADINSVSDEKSMQYKETFPNI